MLSVIILIVIILSVINAECHYSECHYSECHYSECHYAEYHYAKKCRGACKMNKFKKCLRRSIKSLFIRPILIRYERIMFRGLIVYEILDIFRDFFRLNF
jgi:hypothetical protein